MSSFTIKDNSKLILSAIDDICKKAMTKCGATAEGYAKKRVHVRTGNLKNSITHKEGKTGNQYYTEIGSNVLYAKYEEGRGGEHAFLRPALHDHKDEYRDIIIRSLRGE